MVKGGSHLPPFDKNVPKDICYTNTSKKRAVSTKTELEVGIHAVY